MSRQLRAYLAGGFRPANESVVLFAKSNQGTLGMYMGRGLDNARTGEPALKVIRVEGILWIIENGYHFPVPIRYITGHLQVVLSSDVARLAGR